MTPIPLAVKYQPHSVAAFIGLDRPRALFSSLVKAPYPSAWLLVGPSGTGKTTMALAAAKQIDGELHHIPSKECNLATVDEVVSRCWYAPMFGQWHVIVCDEADQMSKPAQLAFLSKLDATASPPATIFFFTANSTQALEDRFQSRCRLVRFSTAGLHEPAVKLLRRIWRKETTAKPPDFDAILKEAGYNIRAALMALEMEMIAPTTPEQRAAERDAEVITPATDDEEHQRRSQAAKRAWVTMRANKYRREQQERR